MNSPSVSISWKRAIEIVLLNATMEFFNNSNTNFNLVKPCFNIKYWEFYYIVLIT